MIEVTIWYSVSVGDSCATYLIDTLVNEQERDHFNLAPSVIAIQRALDEFIEESGRSNYKGQGKIKRIDMRDTATKILKP